MYIQSHFSVWIIIDLPMFVKVIWAVDRYGFLAQSGKLMVLGPSALTSTRVKTETKSATKKVVVPEFGLDQHVICLFKRPLEQGKPGEPRHNILHAAAL